MVSEFIALKCINKTISNRLLDAAAINFIYSNILRKYRLRLMHTLSQLRRRTVHESNLIPIWSDLNKIIPPVDSDAELNSVEENQAFKS